MAKAFSIASWNVEHFKNDPTRADWQALQQGRPPAKIEPLK